MYNNSNELLHYGVLGMKWGVRRSQSRSISGSKKTSKRSTKLSDDAREARQIKKKSVREMSNAELKKLNERKNLEQNYTRLNPSHVKRGIVAVAAAATTMNNFLNLYNNSDKIIQVGQKFIKSYPTQYIKIN